MTEKTDWEVVDAPAQNRRSPTLTDLLRALLGRRWRWKIAGIGMLAGLVLAFVVTLVVTVAGVAVLLIGAGALLSLGNGKLRPRLGSSGRAGVPRAP